MQPNHQHADDVVLAFDDRCQNCDLCPLVWRRSMWQDDRYVKLLRGWQTDETQI